MAIPAWLGLPVGLQSIVLSQEQGSQRNVSWTQCCPILQKKHHKKGAVYFPLPVHAPLASRAWAHSSWSPFMCRGTKGENNICIFHSSPYNIWVGSVARQGFGELFLCWALNDKLFVQEHILLVLPHSPGGLCGGKAPKTPFIPQTCALQKGLWTFGTAG